MKKIALRGFAGLVAFALVAFGAYAGNSAESPEQELPEGQTRVVIPVEGMTCGQCCTKVETAVTKMDGVVAATADYAKGKATITYEEEKVTLKAIVDTINTETSFKASMPEETT